MKTLRVILLMLLPLSAGAVPRAASSSETIQVLVTVPKDSVCHTDDAVSLEIVVLNGGNSQLQIDKNQIHVTAGFNALIDIENMSFRHETESSVGDTIRPRDPQVSVIPSKGYLNIERRVPLPKSLFTKDGFYRMNLTASLGGTEVLVSRSFTLELRDCH